MNIKAKNKIGKLTISNNKKYIMCDNKPFFWLGDTAWLLFSNISEEEAFVYLKNRADKSFNVIQAVLVYSTPELEDINKMDTLFNDVNSIEYWEHCDRVIKMAESLGLYMALLPTWGSLVKNGFLNESNVEKYTHFLADRYKDCKNIIWVLGGDIRGEKYIKLYNTMGNILKEKNADKLITFHPFGRCSSSQWFNDEKWLDFNMFQSGHRRYDQGSLNQWDDNRGKEEFFGEDNWRYVLRDKSKNPLKPTLDGEPSYEWILQGLHDETQPYWKAIHIRRYAYWSVFAGACGHTYGDNAIMQFHTKGKGSYGVVCNWKEALHHEGSGQMKYLYELMTSVDFTTGEPREDLLIGGQKEKHERVAVFGGKDFLFAYSWLGKDFALNTGEYVGGEAWWFSPDNGIYSYVGKVKDRFEARALKGDIVLVVRKFKFS